MNKPQYTVSIMTLGCRVNQYESDFFADSLKNLGVNIVPFGEKCDLSIINTCTVTSESDRKSRQMIRRATAYSKKTVVTGCFAQISPDAASQIDNVVYVCGNSGKAKLAETVYKILSDEYKGKKNDTEPPNDMDSVTITLTTPMRCRSYIKIEDGCGNRCSYCIISSARGPVRSKPTELVLKEVAALAADGCREIILTGIETASYGLDFENKLPYGYSLANLILEISKIDGIERIGLGSLDPTVMSEYFTSTVSGITKLLPHFHLSIQSGSSEILAAMRRKYNSSQAAEAIARMKSAIPDATFSADIIVGFPGETEENFSQTVDFCRQSDFLHLHIFPYSKRAGTEAALMKNQISEQIKHSRLRTLEKIGADIKKNILLNYVSNHYSSPVYVLVEKSENNITSGHSEHFIEIRINGIEETIGNIIPVLLDKTNGEICEGHVI